MHIWLTGAAFWVLAIAAVARLLALGRAPGRISGLRIALGLIALAGAVVLYFRPHETIFGGQDDGAYLNFGARLARKPQLLYYDRLFAQVPPDARADFLYYGPGRPYLSKFACGMVRDLDSGLMGTWFQPAYPMAMSVIAKLGRPRWILYVVPLFAIFTALALRALARQLLPHPWAGSLAFLFYLLCPLAAWHGRNPRPEVIASFLLFAAAALFVEAWGRPRWSRWLDLVLASACLAAAPFFHITAWMLVAPAGALLTLAVLSGRDDFLVYHAVQAAALGLFTWQLVRITDTYSLLRFLGVVAAHPGAFAFLAVLGMAILGALASAARRRHADAPPRESSWPGWAAAALVLAAYAACYVLARLAPITRDTPAVFYLAHRTDLPAVLNLLSPVVGLLALAGLAALAARPGPRAVERVALLAFAVPATLMVGNFFNFFVTRYLVVALVPLFVLGLVSVLSLIPASRTWQASVVGLCAAVVLVAMLNGRTHLLRLVEYKGLWNYLAGYADGIREQRGILLFEYPRLAAPFDHIFGIPTLALHNERSDDYSRAEAAWEGILRNHPDVPAYFITPFQAPISDRFGFEPVKYTPYSGRRLVHRRWELPTEVGEWGVSLGMFRMTFIAADHLFPFVYTFDAGNMGLRGFGRGMERRWEMDGVPVSAGAPLDVSLPPGKRRDLLIFLAADPAAGQPQVTASSRAGDTPAEMTHLGGEWWLARAGVTKSGRRVTLRFSAPAFVTDVLAAGPGGAASVVLPAGERREVEAFPARWARKGSQFCAPIPDSGTGYVLAQLTAPSELDAPVHADLLGASGTSLPGSLVPPGRWCWVAWPVKTMPGRRPEWFSVNTEATVDDESLTVLMGRVVVLE